MTRWELHKERREQILREATIASSADQLESQFASTVARLNKISPSILAGYEKTGISVRNVTVADNTDKTAYQRLSDYEQAIDQHKLAAFINQHDELVDKVVGQRSFTLSPNNDIVLNATELSAEYAQYELAYENYLQINLQRHLKLLASQQNFERIDAIVQRIEQRVAAGAKLESKDNQEDLVALDEVQALVAKRNETAAKEFVDEEFFKNFKLDAVKSVRRIKMRRWIMITSFLGIAAAVACVILFALYATGIV